MTNNLNHWSNYWKNGNLTSLPQDFHENYDGEIAGFWHRHFANLKPNSSILDVCTGNGAIALLAAKYSEQNHLHAQITAVDAARIDINLLKEKYRHLTDSFQCINFISECKVEDIDLPADTFDLITSQYGIEYCNWSLSAIQIARLLKPGGIFICISHAGTTDIVVYMTQEQDEYNILKELGFFAIFNNYFKKNKNHKDTVRSLKKLQVKLSGTVKQNQHGLIPGILNFLQYLINVDKRTFLAQEEKMKSYVHQHIYAYNRLKDVLGVTQKIANNPDWFEVFSNQGLTLEKSGEVLQGGVHNAGTFYKFRK